jgi:hypothetical protein
MSGGTYPTYETQLLSPRWYLNFRGRISKIHHARRSFSWSYIGDSTSFKSSSSSVPTCTVFIAFVGLTGGESISGTECGSNFLLRREKERLIHDGGERGGSSKTASPTGIGGGRGVTNGYKLDGSRPISRRPLASNMMPVSALKHSRIIHRRGIRARELRVLLLTEPPPTSA